MGKRKKIKLHLNDRIFPSIKRAHEYTKEMFCDAAHKNKVIFHLRFRYWATIKDKKMIRKGRIEWGHKPSSKPNWKTSI